MDRRGIDDDERGGVASDATMTATGQRAPKLAAKPPTPARPATDAAATIDLPAALRDRYEAISLLGRGGMGAVYRARDLRLGREVALKILFEDEGAEQLLREARAQARVEHDHACKIYEVGIEDGARYIAMQLVDGEPFDRAAEGMSLEQRARVVRQVALALHEAHRLGLVHRDVKPSNVLVERGEDGAFRPYLTDFGIAREAGAAGPTLTGAIAGTPAFMAPEQASGKVRALDRRTDVYSLGATLYAVVTGRPPFAAANPWTLLRRIMTEDAPPLRRAAPAAPADLEAIVARCLEREPSRRYPSAKALAEDLQRFLDGDPVEARRLSPAYVLLRKARRHRAPVALIGAALAAAALVVTLWARDRRLAAHRAELSRELGEDVKEMDLFLRSAYGLPLHDVERERDLVRARLHAVEARMAAAGPAGVGPGHYAMGRGYLALQEPDTALAHLRQAIAAGYASPELDYAMGLALGELYDRAVVVAKRIDDAERQKARLADLSAEYAAPAARHLRAALAARLDAPEYVEGLIALREGRPEEALAKARAAFEKAPWLPEAKRLEGDARFAMGRPFGHDAAFDYEKMIVEYRAAAEAYRAAGEIARSDPRAHEAACRLWAQIMLASSARPETFAPSHEEAAAACGRAIAASSRGVSPRIERAFVQVTYARLVAGGSAPEDPGTVVDEAIAQATEAARLAPGEPMAPYLVGLASSARASYLVNRGADGRASIDRAVAAYEEALRLDPNFVWALDDLATAYLQRAVDEGLRGRDPTAWVERAVEQTKRAAALDGHPYLAYDIQSYALAFLAEHLADVGRDPALVTARARAAVEASRALAPDAGGFVLAYLSWIEASYAAASGGDPTPALARGDALAATEVRRAPDAPGTHELLGKLAATRALYLLETGADPRSALEAARAAFRRASEATPWDVSYRVGRARVEILALRWTARARAVEPEAVAAVAEPLVRRVAAPLVDPTPAETLAELDEILAASQAARGQPPDRAVAEGLARANDAIALNPHDGAAHAVLGELYLVRARAAKDPEQRQRAAQAAVDTFSAAAQSNPLLARRTGPALRAAGEILRP